MFVPKNTKPDGTDSHYKQSGNSVYELTDHLGNVRAAFAVYNGSTNTLNATDYFSGGMAMPNRNIVGDYRYDWQGQELDRETGKHAFELRLYDSRINRWLTTDPKKEFHSPYLAMGNNWINRIDPDGGSTASPDNDYTLHKDGTLTVEYTDDKFDRLFVEGKNGFDLINDQSILSSLYQTQFDGISMATVGAGSKEDLFKVFKTAADNSNPEWRIIRSTKNQYILGTKFDEGYSPSSTQLGLAGDHEIFASIHSHPDIYVNPGDTFFQSEKKSMGYGISRGVAYGDAANLVNAKKNGQPRHKEYIYVPQSGRLWKVDLTKPHYIRHINGNSGRFFFGIF